MMRAIFIIALALGAAGLPALAETLVKASAPFSFPAVSIPEQGRPAKGPSSFKVDVYQDHLAFSWNVAASGEIGEITINKVSGARQQVIPLKNGKGLVSLNLRERPLSLGVYIAGIRIGSFTQETKFAIVK